MKYLFKPTFLYCALFITASSFSSCMKEKEIAVTPTAAMNMINTTPATDSINFYFDKQIVNEGLVNYGKKTEMIVFGEGNHELLISKSTANRPLASLSGSFKRDNFYTLFVTATSTGPLLILNADSLTNKDEKKSKVRFANMSYNAPAINLTTTSGIWFTNVPFKKISSWKDVEPGNYILTIADNASQTDKVSQSITLEPNKIYTIWGSGSWDSSTGKMAYALQSIAY
ncbi:MAG: DUF4397 domain-containing protein [Sphingobacteriaceae bacterium]